MLYHSIKSMGDYQEYRLDTPIDLARTHGLVAGIEPFDPHIFINVAVQRATRFGYRTTMGMNRSGRGPMVFWMPQRGEVAQRRVPQILRCPQHPNTAFAATSGSTARSSTSSPCITRAAATAFRRNIYQQNLWVRSSDSGRIRESSPEFYRMNPAQTHRLVPWLTRELAALMDVTVSYYHDHACHEILNWITIYPINSHDFKRLAQSYFGGKTDHFVHEFYNFAVSPHDMPAYDNHARYTPSNAELETAAPTDDSMVFENLDLPPEPNFDPLQQYRRPVVQSLFGYDYQGLPRRVPSNVRRALDTARPTDPRLPLSAPEVIILSSDEEPAAAAAAESDGSDSEVMIIGSLPPMHLRTPEVITLDDSGDDSDVIEIKPATPPLIEIADDSDSHATSLPSASGVAGTSSSPPDALPGQKRTARCRYFRPSYREYSSTSDEENIPSKKAPKKKTSEKKRLTRSSSKRYKSSKYVDSSSNSDSEDSDGLVKKESEAERGASQSSDDNSLPESSSIRDRTRERHTQVSKARASRRTLKKRSGSERRNSSSSSSCVRCLKPKKRDSTSSRAKSPGSKKKRSRSVSSDSSFSNYRRSKPRLEYDSPDDHEESRSSISLDVETEDNPPETTVSLAPNPKALSKKAIILNRRKSEMLSDQSTDAGPSNMSNGADAKKTMLHLLSASDTDQDTSLDNKESVTSYGCPPMSDNPNINYSKMKQESDLVNQLPGISIYSSDTSSSILSMGQEYTTGFGLDAGGSNGQSSTNLLPSSQNVYSIEHNIDNPPGWNQDDAPTRPPRSCSSSSSSSSSTACSSHSILNVTSVDPVPPDPYDESFPELTLNSIEENGGDGFSAAASSPPNLRRFDDASSPIISLNHSPLQSDSSSSSNASVTSPPRLKSIVFLRVPSPSRRQPLYLPYPSTPPPLSSSSSSDENDDY